MCEVDSGADGTEGSSLDRSEESIPYPRSPGTKIKVQNFGYLGFGTKIEVQDFGNLGVGKKIEVQDFGYLGFGVAQST